MGYKGCSCVDVLYRRHFFGEWVALEDSSTDRFALLVEPNVLHIHIPFPNNQVLVYAPTSYSCLSLTVGVFRVSNKVLLTRPLVFASGTLGAIAEGSRRLDTYLLGAGTRVSMSGAVNQD